MQIRVALSSDAAAVEALLRAVPGVWQPAWRSDVVTRAIEAAAGLAFVAAEGARVIGFACAHDTSFRAYLSELVVADASQWKGIGRALLSAIQQAIAARGCAVLVADVHPPAAAFYRALGWSEPRATLLRIALPSNDRA